MFTLITGGIFYYKTNSNNYKPLIASTIADIITSFVLLALAVKLNSHQTLSQAEYTKMAIMGGMGMTNLAGVALIGSAILVDLQSKEQERLTTN